MQLGQTARLACLALAITSWTAIGCVAQTPETIAGIGPAGPIVKVSGSHVFTEGPAPDQQGNLYFTDVRDERIYKLDSSGVISIFLDPSGIANGLMFDARGTLYACQMAGQLVSLDTATAKATVLADTYQGTRLNAPNDLVLDTQGGIYFTDPLFRAPQPLPQTVQAVYYRSPTGKVTRLVDDLAAPNGVILSPDEKTLYVVPSMQKEMMAYDVLAPGKIGPGRVLCTLTQPESVGKGGRISGGDGLTVDTRGNLYITSSLGVQVFTPEGEQLGIITFPEQPANVAFGGPEMKTLYVTARTSLYSTPMIATGHRFSGKKD